MASSNASGLVSHLRTTNFADVRRRLRSEHGPAVQSQDEISNMLALVDKDLDDCKAEIDRLQSELHRLHSHAVALENQRQRLERHKACLHSLRSPFRRLPNEILRRIFIYVCNMNQLTSRNLLKLPALNISAVCSRWRDLAKSFPDLWSCLRLRMGNCRLRLLNLYLESSQQSPLTLELLWTLEPAVCRAISKCSHRWKRLSVFDASTYDALMAYNPTHFPVLEELSFSFNSSRPLHRFQNASKLRSLCVSIRDVQIHEFPWEQLAVLNIRCDETIEAIFERCLNLKEVRFRASQVFKCCVPPVKVASVEKLELSLCDMFENTPNVFLDSITCPSLKSLFIKLVWGYQLTWPKDELHSFILRSSCRLTTLSIQHMALSDSDLIDLLHCLPDLLHLTIDDSSVSSIPSTKSPITPHIVQALHAFPSTTSTTASPLVAKLQSLAFTFSGSAFSDKDFVDMVSSRWNPEIYAGHGSRRPSPTGEDEHDVEITCLRSVVMRFTNRDVNEEIYRPLMHLEEVGMRVVVIGKNSKTCTLV